tara:strand:+ start:234 stop:539 length:306 start_codon:yes stop_codon:yes gene_type:complete
MTQFTGQAGRGITAVLSASGGAYSHEFSFGASTLFLGGSTIYSSSEGLSFASDGSSDQQWIWFAPATAEAYTEEGTHYGHIRASATGQFFISPTFDFEIDA